MFIIHDPSAPQCRYSHYLAELLRLEGLVSSQDCNLADLNESTLVGHNIVILPRTTLDRNQDDMHASGRRLPRRLLSHQSDHTTDHHAGRLHARIRHIVLADAGPVYAVTGLHVTH